MGKRYRYALTANFRTSFGIPSGSSVLPFRRSLAAAVTSMDEISDISEISNWSLGGGSNPFVRPAGKSVPTMLSRCPGRSIPGMAFLRFHFFMTFLYGRLHGPSSTISQISFQFSSLTASIKLAKAFLYFLKAVFSVV